MTSVPAPVPRRLPSEEEARRPRVVVTTVSSDSHTWNLVWLQMVMEEFGCNVTNLGPCVPDDLVIATCLAYRPDLLLVSSVNGHGAIDGRRLLQRLRQTPGLMDLPAVIGGKLGIAGELCWNERRSLLEAGFDLVLEDTGSSSLRQLKALVLGKRDADDVQ